jgi:hypothetical protein
MEAASQLLQLNCSLETDEGSRFCCIQVRENRSPEQSLKGRLKLARWSGVQPKADRGRIMLKVTDHFG